MSLFVSHVQPCGNMSFHHCEWTFEISSFDRSTFVVLLGQLYKIYVIILVLILLIVRIHLLNKLIPPIYWLWIFGFFILYLIVHLNMNHWFVTSIIIIQKFILHMKFYNQYFFDLKIFHPFLFIAPHLWFFCYNLHLPPLYENPLLEVHLHSTPNILAFVVLVYEFQIPYLCMAQACSH